MLQTTEINSAFYALRLLSHGIKTSEIEIVAGNDYPGSEFTEEEQSNALKIIRAIEEEESSSFDALAPERRQVHVDALADQIERISNAELENAGYTVDSKYEKVRNAVMRAKHDMLATHMMQALNNTSQSISVAIKRPDFADVLLVAVETAGALRKVANILGLSHAGLLRRVNAYRSLHRQAKPKTHPQARRLDRAD